VLTVSRRQYHLPTLLCHISKSKCRLPSQILIALPTTLSSHLTESSFHLALTWLPCRLRLVSVNPRDIIRMSYRRTKPRHQLCLVLSRHIYLLLLYHCATSRRYISKVESHLQLVGTKGITTFGLLHFTEPRSPLSCHFHRVASRRLPRLIKSRLCLWLLDTSRRIRHSLFLSHRDVPLSRAETFRCQQHLHVPPRPCHHFCLTFVRAVPNDITKKE
jgi:hypothetical protein